MKKEQVYAIVDIESTGGSIGTGERMIQFACVLVRNGKVLEKFNTYVNPLKQVPKQIQELTGIRPNDLKGAPFFEDIAELIHGLLEDTIFVAHNVGFDYRFLNEEFNNVGLRSLTIPAIDTVELSQILFPRADSYNLQELADWLGYDLDRPHDALGDAEATTFILQKLEKRVLELPLVTLEKLVELSSYCVAETHLFFDDVLAEMKETPANLSDDLIVVEGIALRNPSASKGSQEALYRTESFYPKTTIEKENLFNGDLLTREDQEEMMDAVYHFLNEENPEKELAIEVGSGAGKSLGYLLPASFLATSSKPVVISTYTTVLQKQLLEETIPILKKLLPFELNVALVKSRRHYLSLERFDQKLRQATPDNVEALLCMRLLVWLTETVTGDLEEISAGSHNNHDFWQEVRSRKSSEALNQKNWSEFDFYTRLQKQIQGSSILVTNHAFLAYDWKKEEKMLPKFARLIVDEAHHLPDVLQEASVETLNGHMLKNFLKALGNQVSERSLVAELTPLLPRQILKKHQLDTLDMNRQFLEEEWNEFVKHWLSKLETDEMFGNTVLEWKEREFSTNNQTLLEKKMLKRIKVLTNEILFLGNHIVEVCLKESKQLSLTERFTVDQLYYVLLQLTEWENTLSKIFAPHDGEKLNWVSYYTKNAFRSITFQSNRTQSSQQLLEKLHSCSHVLYTSSTLSVDDDLRFFKEQIGTNKIDFLTLSSPYDYQNQVKVFLPSGTGQPLKENKKQYVKILADSIEKIVQEVDENTLVLFRSLETLQHVYYELKSHSVLNGYEVLAQHLSGTRTKLLKQFKKSKKTVLLGADSFWEGIDLPGNTLRVVIVTRLPFDSPDIPLIKRRHQQLEKAGKNPFTMDLLPNAVLKMKQGFGRLIRSPEDKGAFIILDDRFLYSSYGKLFQKAIPENVTIEEISLTEIGKSIKLFLDK